MRDFLYLHLVSTGMLRHPQASFFMARQPFRDKPYPLHPLLYELTYVAFRPHRHHGPHEGEYPAYPLHFTEHHKGQLRLVSEEALEAIQRDWRELCGASRRLLTRFASFLDHLRAGPRWFARGKG
jgi:hypothetical protein